MRYWTWPKFFIILLNEMVQWSQRVFYAKNVLFNLSSNLRKKFNENLLTFNPKYISLETISVSFLSQILNTSRFKFKFKVTNFQYRTYLFLQSRMLSTSYSHTLLVLHSKGVPLDLLANIIIECSNLLCEVQVTK